MFGWLSNDAVSARNGVSGTLGMKEWFAVWALNLVSMIPIIGLIVYLIIFIKLGWGKNTAPSLANQIKFNLLMSIIVLALVIVALIICVAAGVSFANWAAK